MSLADEFMAQAGVALGSEPSTRSLAPKSLSEQFAEQAAGAATADASNPNYQAGQNLSSMKRGALTALNGPTFGFGDELLGAIGGSYDTLRSGGSLADNYRANRDTVRGAVDQMQHDAPWTSAGLQLTASLPLGVLQPVERAAAWAVPKVAPYILPAARSAQASMGLGQQMLRTGASGVLNGTVSGLGNSQAENAGDAALDTAKAAGLGMVLGPVMTPIIRGVVGVGSNIAQRVSDTSAYKAAQSKIAEALTRDAQGSVFQSGAANPVNQAASRLYSLGPTATVADAAGQSTRQLLDTLAILPGGTKDAATQLLRNRQAGSASRLITAADDAMGTAGLRLQGTLDDLIEVQRQASAPLYEAVNNTIISQPSKSLQSAVQAADALGATKLGQTLSTARQVPYTLDPNNPSGWALRDLDHVKQALDNTISHEWDAVKGKLTPKGQAFLDLKTSLVSALDGATTNRQTGRSVYADARNAFAGPEALMDAARLGRTSINKPEDAVGNLVRSLSASEMDAYKVGAMEALRQKLGASLGGRTEILNMWQNPAMADKLKLMFGDQQSFREFAATVAKERTLKLLNSTGAGSQTAARQYGAGDLDSAALKEAGATVASAASGNPVAAMGSAAKLWNSVQMPEPVRDQMGRILLSQGPAGQQNLSAMRALTQRINDERARLAVQSGLLFSQPNNPASIIGSGLLGY